MNITFVQTQNVVNLNSAIQNLQNRDKEVPGLGLVHGRAGLGKTKALVWYSVNQDATYVRAKAIWTPRYMLADICTQLDEFPYNRTNKLYNQAAGALERINQPLIIDEADYLLRNSKMLDTIRDLHDETGVPIVLVGMDEISGKLLNFRQFWSRISQVVEFCPLTAPEISMLAKAWTGLQVEPAAAQLLIKHTDGDFRLITVCLYHLEKAATVNKLESINTKLVETVAKKSLRRRKS